MLGASGPLLFKFVDRRAATVAEALKELQTLLRFAGKDGVVDAWAPGGRKITPERLVILARSDGHKEDIAMPSEAPPGQSTVTLV